MSRLSFYARGTAQVTDPHAQDRGVRRCIGRRWQEVVTGRWAWVPTGKPQSTDFHPDLVRACRDGDLWAADEETAKACGVGFDPSFGGELTETIKAFKEKLAAQAAAAKAATPEAPQETKAGKAAGGKGDV